MGGGKDESESRDPLILRCLTADGRARCLELSERPITSRVSKIFTLTAAALLLAGPAQAEIERFSFQWTLWDPCFAPEQVIDCEADVWRVSNAKREITRCRGTCVSEATGEEWDLWGRTTNTRYDGTGLFQTGTVYFRSRDSGYMVHVHWRAHEGDLFGGVTKFECEP
jgi:hypothetical protein